MTQRPFFVVIPARYASTRLPGKPLRLLAGKPMVQHVYENALSSGAAKIVVATEDARIVDAVEAFGGSAMLTDEAHPSGTDRIAEVARRLAWHEEDIVVNLQGDEPGIPGELVAKAARALETNQQAGIATLATAIRDLSSLRNPNVVKVVLDEAGLALLFSRAPIPWCRDSFAFGLDQLESLPQEATFLRHLGIYAYRVGVLQRVSAAPPRPLERAESLEQLRAMAMGIRIHVTVLEKAPAHGVDTEADLAAAEVAARIGAHQ